MRRVKLYVLQQERIRSFLLIAQHPEAVLLYQGTCGNVEALQHLSGWEFCVSETSSVIFQKDCQIVPLYKFQCVKTRKNVKTYVKTGFFCVILVELTAKNCNLRNVLVQHFLSRKFKFLSNR